MAQSIDPTLNSAITNQVGNIAIDGNLADWTANDRLDAMARSILILCDGGGSNSSRYYVFKEALQKLVNHIGIEICIAHYPPYTSKYNPIEHRLFPHLSRACRVDRDRQFFKSSIGLKEPWARSRQIPLLHSFCQHVFILQFHMVRDIHY